MVVSDGPPTHPVLYRALPAGHTHYANASLARLFVTLTHETEWGGAKPHLVRFEGPVRVALEGSAAASYGPFLDDYMTYLRRHTGIDISRVPGPGNMTIRLVPGRLFTSLLPDAACVLVSGDVSWDDFADRPDAMGGIAMTRARALEAVTIFIPDMAIPADLRRCLLEEIAQGLGPVNDLYGLGPSVFNDDFGHLWPTRLDLLMLRVLYDPSLETGLGRAETERRARAVLDRINPAGRRAAPLPPAEHRAEARWRSLVGEVLRSDRSAEARRLAARDALGFAEAALPGTPWHCHSLALRAQVEKRADPALAARLLSQAETVCARVHGAEDPRLAQARLTRAGIALAQADPETALAATDGLAPTLAGHGLDEALAAYYALRARALLSLGREADGRAASQAAAAWGAYAIGRAAKGTR
ncbi:MAG: DUF2927 domain-containing protein [Pikeienuella sp.]